MTLWVDKNRPTTLDKLSYHHELTSHLKKMAETLDIPHLLFYGPEGAGKKTRIMTLLRQIFGPGAEKIRMDTRTFQTTSSRSVEVNILSSNYHIEINPSDAGIYDRVIVQELIKEIAQTQQVNSSSLKKFKVVVIHDADTLSKNAQHALRRTMEKYM
ncbi:Replication factor C subunit 5, partial [Smittium culicis]